MSWESPIDVVYEEVGRTFEGAVLESVQRVGIKVDRKELIQALNYDRKQYEKGYTDGEYAAKAHGFWEGYLNDWRCSVCWRFGIEDYEYCPWCGARMDLRDE